MAFLPEPGEILPEFVGDEDDRLRQEYQLILLMLPL